MKRKLSAIFKFIGKILLGLVCLAAALIPAIAVNKIYGYLLALLMIAFVGISIAVMFILRRNIKVETSGGYIVRRRGEEADVDLKLVNTSFLSCPGADANVYISDIFGQVNASRTSRFVLTGGDSVSFGFDADMSHIGIYSVGIDRIKVYDLTGVFHTTIPVNGKYSACIMPKRRRMEELNIAEDITAQSSNNTRVIIAGGTDYSGVREYALGDPMKQIHWKLSAHAAEYMTKLQENNRQQEYTVVLDFASIKYNDREVLMDVNDTLIETALSLITDISASDNGYRLLYCDRNRNVRHVIPKGLENDMEMISNFIPIEDEPDRTFPDAAEILQMEAKEQNRSTNVIVVTSRPMPDLIQELVNVNNQRRSPELFVVVPAHWNSREREEHMENARVLNEYGIPYYVIATDVNRSQDFYDIAGSAEGRLSDAEGRLSDGAQEGGGK